MPEHIGFSEDHHELVGTTDFDFGAVDEALGFIHESRPAARQEAAELFRQLAAWCFRGDKPLRAAAVRFVAIVSGLRPDLVGDRTMKEIASEFGITKQAMSAQSAKFSDAFGIKFARCRSKEAREHMARARIGGPNRNIQSHQTKHDETRNPEKPA
jgi:hypothetical protein